MAHINLLPWRERMREERKREFFSIIIGVAVIAGGLLFLVDRYFNGEINTQNARNGFIQAEILLLDEQVTEINQLRQQKEDIRSRMTVINDLQGTRPVMALRSICRYPHCPGVWVLPSGQAARRAKNNRGWPANYSHRLRRPDGIHR